jgi:hypothetical protein
LLTYTLEELAYEFFDHKERDAYALEEQSGESDKIEEAKYDEAMKWADEEEAKEKADKEKLAEAKPQDAANAVPTITTEDQAWMDKHIQEGQLVEQIGADIVEEF